MLLKFKDIRDKYAIGLRWAVDTKQGVEMIQYNYNLNYGFLLDIRGDEKNKLKIVALSNEEHDRTISLAGIFSKKYENLILVHRVNDSLYWVCVIKNSEVWMGMDVGQATAGDLIGELSVVQKVVTAAQAEFAEEEISLEGAMLCSDAAWSDFQSFENVNFIEQILGATKFKRQFEVRYLEPTKVVLQKVILAIVFIGAIILVGYYFYHQKDLKKLLQLQAQQQKEAKLRKEQAERRYYTTLYDKLANQWGYNVIDNLMLNFKYLALQSRGWALDSAIYDATKPDTMLVDLKRSSYGTVNSFYYAYTPKGEAGALKATNDEGTKEITFPKVELSMKSPEITRDELSDEVPKQLFKLISYMQLSADTFNFKVGKKQVSKYKIQATGFTLSGDSLWKLKSAQLIFKNFPTLVINEIDLKVQDYDMSWTLKGQVYA